MDKGNKNRGWMFMNTTCERTNAEMIILRINQNHCKQHMRLLMA